EIIEAINNSLNRSIHSEIKNILDSNKNEIIEAINNSLNRSIHSEIKNILDSNKNEIIEAINNSLNRSIHDVLNNLNNTNTSLNEIKSIASQKLDDLMAEIKRVEDNLIGVCSKTVEETYEDILKDITRFIYLDTIKKNFIKNFEYLVRHANIDKQSVCDKVGQRFLKIDDIEGMHISDVLDYIASISIAENCDFGQNNMNNIKRIEEKITEFIKEIIKKNISAQELVNKICNRGRR
ncbi:MAG: hypothetical protein QXL19_09270, partial [Ignisphaera sp.]